VRTSLAFCHHDRQLEARATISGGDWHIWIYERGEAIFLHSVVAGNAIGSPTAQLEAVLAAARRDIENETFIIPIVRRWPRNSADAAK
jgi:hypothetical protein